MCELPDAAANSDVSDLKERVKRYINPALQYACRSWHTHLIGGRAAPISAPDITSALHRFLETKFLSWLEVLSVLGAVRNAVDALQVTVGWLEVRWNSMVGVLPGITETRFRIHLLLSSPTTAPVLSPHSLKSSAHPPPISITQRWHWPRKRRSCGSYTNHNLPYESYLDYQFPGT